MNVVICILRFYFSIFFFTLSSVPAFLNTDARDLTSAGRALFFTRAQSDVVWTGGLSVDHGNLSMAAFILINRIHTYWWAAVVRRSNYLILDYEP